MFIHSLARTGDRMAFSKQRVARNHKRILGNGVVAKVYENGDIHKCTDTLRALKLAKPKIARKFINFDE